VPWEVTPRSDIPTTQGVHAKQAPPSSMVMLPVLEVAARILCPIESERSGTEERHALRFDFAHVARRSRPVLLDAFCRVVHKA
jgi:hypothetical protein